MAAIQGIWCTILGIFQETWVVLHPWRPCQALVGAVDGAEPSPGLGHSGALQSTVAGGSSLVLRGDVVQL